MEFSDDEEEIIDLNTDKKNSKDNDKKEKSKSKTSSSKNMKWVKSSLECISQMAKSEMEENEFSEYNENPNNFVEEENDVQNKENILDNNNNDKDNNDYNDDDNNDNINDFTEQTTETFPDSNIPKNKNMYMFTWEEGGNNVKLIGSFSNWKEQYEMEKDEKDKIYKFSLPLNNEIYQYKFIVDGVWKCSKNQNTIDDGKGNINNILDLTSIKPKEDINKKNLNKKNSKGVKKGKAKEKKKNEKKKSNLNLNKEKKKELKKRQYGNVYPDNMSLTEPNNSDIISKAFNINNESKQKKIGNPKYYKYVPNNSYSSGKSYLYISTYRHTILNHILFQKTIKKNSEIKIGISFRYREKAATLIYYN